MRASQSYEGAKQLFAFRGLREGYVAERRAPGMLHPVCESGTSCENPVVS
jgi:hypothetical protein